MRFRNRTQSCRRQLVGAKGAIFLALFFIDLPEMIADFAVLPKSPGGCDIFFSLVEIALAEINPAQRVPVGNERRNQRQLLLRKTSKSQSAWRRRVCRQ